MRHGIEDMHQLQELVRLHRMGSTASRVAKTLGLARKTERRYRKLIAAAGLLAGGPDDLPELSELRRAVRTDRKTPKQERSTVAKHEEYILQKYKDGLGPTAIHGLLAVPVGVQRNTLRDANPVARGRRDPVQRNRWPRDVACQPVQALAVARTAPSGSQATFSRIRPD